MKRVECNDAAIGTSFITKTETSIAIILTNEGSLGFWGTVNKDISWYFNLPYDYYKKDVSGWHEL